jgi:hypothetical protein
MDKNLLRVSLRHNAIIVPPVTTERLTLTEPAGLLAANLGKLGYSLSEDLLHALNGATVNWHIAVLETFREVMGVSKNWTPLVKGWNVPTGESIADHIITFFTNIFGGAGTTLPCRHIIPDGTFPLERYNGCPYCGRPFAFGELKLYKQGSETKELNLWHEGDAKTFLFDLLSSKTALDATQLDSLRILLRAFPLPEEVEIKMKETVMVVIAALVEKGEGARAGGYFASPVDVMRYLWYKHIGFLQILEPASIVGRTSRNHRHLFAPLDTSAGAKLITTATLKLKYTRKQCALAAGWLNSLPMDAQKMCETMHPKRRMWVRFIRALRLAEWAGRPGYEKLAEVLDRFYKGDYPVWLGQVEGGRLRYDAATTFTLLQARPGAFARSLFANMLWFGCDKAMAAFTPVAEKVPARLLFTLAMYADLYFEQDAQRPVKPLSGNQKTIPANRLVKLYEPEDLDNMKEAVKELCLSQMGRRFAALPRSAATMHIHPLLYKMPVAIGDRGETVQDTACALMGARFPVSGDAVRLFMQWGTGLSAQHMDMDLSCQIAYRSGTEFCSYYNLVATGCKHSGDIRHIPENVGTAEYIELDLATLRAAEAMYVTFTCNAYSNGSITPNMLVGWMASGNEMTISESTGVAYDPSCVQHQVRITGALTKGLVFGVLDVAKHEVVWLELPYYGQVVQQLDRRGVEAMLKRLDSKLNIGQLLALKAAAQGMKLVEEEASAEEVYTPLWAQNAAAVTQLLVD